MMRNSSVFVSFNFGFGCFGLLSHQTPFPQLSCGRGCSGLVETKIEQKGEWIFDFHSPGGQKQE